MLTLKGVTKLLANKNADKAALRVFRKGFSGRIVKPDSERVSGEADGEKIKPFCDIPEPDRLPLIGTALDYSPIRNFDIKYIHELWKKRIGKHGPIYKERVMPGSDYILYCSSASDCETMFRNDGRTPIRDALPNVRYVREVLGLPLGLMNVSGKEWYRIRSAVNPLMLRDPGVWKYLALQRSISSDLTYYIREHLDRNGEVANFDKILNMWAFEMTAVFVYDTRLGLFRDKMDTTAKDVIQCSLKMFEIVGETLYGPQIWKYIHTKKMQELCDAQTRQIECTSHYYDISTASSQQKKTDNEKTMIEKIICCPELTTSEKKMMASDLLLAGIDTTSNACAFILYCLALNQDAQGKARKEVLEVVGKDEITGQDLEKLKYVNAVIKETQRMFPFVTSHSRRASRDLVLSGYHVPEGTNILNISNSVHGRDPEYFHNPNEFLPERWIGQRPRDRFIMTGSFGMGARKCLGRKFAMQEIKLLLIAVLSEFRVEYHHKPIRIAFKLTSYPSEKPQFTFIPLKK